MHNWRFMLALALWFVPVGRAWAQPALQYDAPVQCPDRDFFLARVNARLHADGRHARPGARLFVKLQPRTAGVRARLRIEQGAYRAQRSLVADTCEEAAEGLALIAALAIAMPAAVDASAASDLDTAEPRPSPRARERDDVPPPDAQSPAERAPTAPRSSQPAVNTPTSAPEPEAARSTEVDEPNEPAKRAPVQTTPPEAGAAGPYAGASTVAERHTDMRWSVGAGAVALHGLAPMLQPGLQLEAAVRLASSTIDWTLRLGGRVALGSEQLGPAGKARFGLWSGLAQLCAGLSSARAAELHVCAVAEPGLYLAVGADTEDARSYRRAWFAAGAGVGASWWIAPWFGLRTGAELLVPARRDSALLAGEVIHRVPAVCIRLMLGVEVALP